MEGTNWDLNWAGADDSVPFGVGGPGGDSAAEWSWGAEMGGSRRPRTLSQCTCRHNSELGGTDRLLQREGTIKK